MSYPQNPPTPLGPPPLQPGQLFSGPYPQPGARRPHVVPGVAHVFVTADGDYLVNQRRPSFGQALSAKRRYDVDVTDRISVLTGNNLPSSENNFYFPYHISLAWRVHDPVAIVRRGIANPDIVIEQLLSKPLREITCQIPPDGWAIAESRLNQRFGVELQLDGGITLIRFSAKLSIDPNLAAYLAKKAELKGQLSLDSMNRAVVEEALQRGDMGILVEHLTKHGDATGDIINLLLQNRQASEQDRQELRKLLLEKGVIQDVDLERFLDSVLPPASGPAPAPPILGPSALALTGGTGVPQPAPPAVNGNQFGSGHPAPPVVQAQPPTVPPVVAPTPPQTTATTTTDASGILSWEDVEPEDSQSGTP